MAAMNVSNGAFSRGNRDALDLLHVLWLKVGIVKRQRLRRRAANTQGGGQRDMYFAGANILGSVHRQCGFMGDDAVHSGAADLRPQGCFHVWAEWGNRVARKPVNAPRDPLDVLATFELYKAYQV